MQNFKKSCFKIQLFLQVFLSYNTFSFYSAESRVRPLVLVVKKWAHYHGINDASRGTLNSYSLVLMVLHYLQSKSVSTVFI